MHSCREVMGTKDLEHGFKLMQGFFSTFRSIDDQVIPIIDP
jgi:aspartyl aminopeptidase